MDAPLARLGWPISVLDPIDPAIEMERRIAFSGEEPNANGLAGCYLVMTHFPHTPGKATPDDRIIAGLHRELLAGLRCANGEELPHLAVADAAHHRSVRIALLHDDAQFADQRRRDYRLDGDGIRGLRRWPAVLKSVGRSLRSIERLDMAEMRRQRVDTARDRDIRLDPEIV